MYSKGSTHTITSACFLPSGRLVTGAIEGQLCSWQGNRCTRQVPGHARGPPTPRPDGSPAYGGVRCLLLQQRGRVLLSGGADGHIIRWDVSSGDLGAQLQIVPLQLGVLAAVPGELPPAIVALDCRPGSSTIMAGRDLLQQLIVKLPLAAWAGLASRAKQPASRVAPGAFGRSVSLAACMRTLVHPLQIHCTNAAPADRGQPTSVPAPPRPHPGTSSCDIWEVDGSPEVVLHGQQGSLVGLAANPAYPHLYASLSASGRLCVWNALKRKVSTTPATTAGTRRHSPVPLRRGARGHRNQCDQSSDRPVPAGAAGGVSGQGRRLLLLLPRRPAPGRGPAVRRHHGAGIPARPAAGVVGQAQQRVGRRHQVQPGRAVAGGR
jgi:hypothetical protein